MTSNLPDPPPDESKPGRARQGPSPKPAQKSHLLRIFVVVAVVCLVMIYRDGRVPDGVTFTMFAVWIIGSALLFRDRLQRAEIRIEDVEKALSALNAIPGVIAHSEWPESEEGPYIVAHAHGERVVVSIEPIVTWMPFATDRHDQEQEARRLLDKRLDDNETDYGFIWLPRALPSVPQSFMNRFDMGPQTWLACGSVRSLKKVTQKLVAQLGQVS